MADQDKETGDGALGDALKKAVAEVEAAAAASETE